MSARRDQVEPEAEARVLPSKGLDLILSSKPLEDTFTVPVRLDEMGIDFTLRFRREPSYSSLQAQARISKSKARETYEHFTGQRKVYLELLDTLSQCFTLNEFCLDEGVTVDKLFKIAMQWGAVFAGIWALFSEGQAMGEAAAFNRQKEQAKNA